MKTVTPYVLFALLAGSLYSVSAAAAEADDGLRHRIVKFADLDLTRNPGIAALYARIKAAARAVCERDRDYGMSSVRAERECQARAMSAAIGTVNVPMLTSYFRDRSGMNTEPALRLAERPLDQSK